MSASADPHPSSLRHGAARGEPTVEALSPGRKEDARLLARASAPTDERVLHPPPPAVVQNYLRAARSPATRRAYATDWALFDHWCATRTDDSGRALLALPASAQTVALYLAEHASTHKPATLTRRCSAISTVHQAAGYDSPTTTALVRTTMAGIRRQHRTAPAAKDPLLAHQVRRLLDALPTDPAQRLLAARDRALLVIGFYGALRRSELVALETRDVEVNEHGLVLTLRRSKTDQDGTGRRIALLHTGSADSCPVETYQAWCQARRAALPSPPAAADGQAADPEDTAPLENARSAPPEIEPRTPVFCGVNRHGQPAPTRLSDRSVARIVQRNATRAGLVEMDVAGHSLRAGFATSAAAAGKSERSIMKQTGHTSLPMVRRYIREGSLYRDNPTDGILL